MHRRRKFGEIGGERQIGGLITALIQLWRLNIGRAMAPSGPRFLCLCNGYIVYIRQKFSAVYASVSAGEDEIEQTRCSKTLIATATNFLF